MKIFAFTCIQHGKPNVFGPLDEPNYGPRFFAYIPRREVRFAYRVYAKDEDMAREMAQGIMDKGSWEWDWPTFEEAKRMDSGKPPIYFVLSDEEN